MFGRTSIFRVRIKAQSSDGVDVAGDALDSSTTIRSANCITLPKQPCLSFSSVRPIPGITDLRDTLFSHAVQLLPLLNNPLNIELLARHTLQSPAVWVNDSVQRYARIVGGFHASLGWKVNDLKEGKGGITLDEWIVAVGRGAAGNGITLPLIVVNLAHAWRHLLMFSGLRSAISEETIVLKKTKEALEHAYIRAFFRAMDDVTRDIAEGIKLLFHC
jgi:hypothetical protein